MGVAIVVLLVAAHVAIVASVLREERSVIWPLHNDTIHRIGPGADFYAIYHAGVNRSQGRSPYAAEPDGRTPYFYVFRYLPIIAVAAEALVRFEPEVAYLGWTLVVEAVLALLLAVLWRRIGRLGSRLAVTGLLLLNSPYFLEIHMGQFTFVSVAVCFLALLLPARELLLTLSVLLKPIALVVLPSLIRERRDWRLVAFVLASLTVLNVPYFVLHPGDWYTFSRENFASSSGYHSGNHGLIYLFFLCARDLGWSWVFAHAVGVVTVVRVAVLGSVALMVLLSKRRSALVGASALLLAHFLTYQDVWEHHMSAVSVVAAMLVTVPGHGRGARTILLMSLFFLALPTPFAVFDVAKDPGVWDPAMTWPAYASYCVVLSKVVPTVALFSFCLVEIIRAGMRSISEAMESIRLIAGRAVPR